MHEPVAVSNEIVDDTMSSGFEGMKLLQVSTVPDTVRRFIAPFASHFQSLGVTVDAAANGVRNDTDCQNIYDNCYDVPFTRKLLSKGNLFGAARRIQEIVAERDYDIVHVHSPIAAFVTRFALRKRAKNLKLIYTAHGFHFMDGDTSLKSRAFKLAEKVAARWMDHLVVINQMDYDNALRLGLGSPSGVSLVHGIGIDLDEFRQRNEADDHRQSIRAEFGLPINATVFLLIAEYTKNKRHCDAITALAKTNNEDFHLVLLGSGTQHESLRQLTVEHGVANRVHAIGFRKDVVAVLLACDTVLLISDREGLPRSIMEAMALGKNVIGTQIRGISDLLKDGVGMLVPPRSPEKLAKAMQQSRSFEPNREARLRVLAACDIDGILSQHENIYQRLTKTNDGDLYG